jgi:hypothetical protein
MASKLQDELDTQRERAVATRPAAINEATARGIEAVRESGIAEQAVGIGDRAPEFALPNVQGREVRLGDLLAQGPVILTFYRGVW